MDQGKDRCLLPSRGPRRGDGQKCQEAQSCLLMRWCFVPWPCKLFSRAWLKECVRLTIVSGTSVLTQNSTGTCALACVSERSPRSQNGQESLLFHRKIAKLYYTRCRPSLEGATEQREDNNCFQDRVMHDEGGTQTKKSTFVTVKHDVGSTEL